MKFNVPLFLEAVPIALRGWLGVIIVIALIVLTVYAFNLIFRDR